MFTALISLLLGSLDDLTRHRIPHDSQALPAIESTSEHSQHIQKFAQPPITVSEYIDTLFFG